MGSNEAVRMNTTAQRGAGPQVQPCVQTLQLGKALVAQTTGQVATWHPGEDSGWWEL